MLPAGRGITAQRGIEWARPVASGGDSSPLFLYSLLLATFLGTMGLPHILVRFYTNPDGPAARRTTVSVLSLLGLFYLFPGIYGLLGRALTPGLYVTGQTDAVVLTVPQAAWPGLPGELLGGVVAAGAFAAFMSTSSGLLVSIAGTLSYDVWPRLRPRQTIGARARQAHFRIAAPLGIVIPVALALVAAEPGHQPARRLGLRPRREHVLPAVPARHLVEPPDRPGRRGRDRRSAARSPPRRSSSTSPTSAARDTAGALLAQPAVVTVPVAFSTMVAVSLLRPGRGEGTDRHLLALHAPEELGFDVTVRDRNAQVGVAAR